ncbi:hypothetical protein [Myceligenerans indicum]|uniref:Uncharacterized protein n=1 Tax=Myceligenerans indicum TaxID=2593663 RepID=A0ABS1LJI6_9MICO|nr:hypothetical protein [Myceligenerans indicum]MBL0886366.1 hypothetical protein [Myceligenerans indicum]
MSYDILAFEPSAVTDADFPAWWEVQSEWPEDHSYNDPSVTTANLQAFYRDLTQIFPPMNGPGVPTDDEIRQAPELESRMTDYSVGTSLIYAAFAWSQAREARTVFSTLAEKYRVAVAWVSDHGSIVRP